MTPEVLTPKQELTKLIHASNPLLVPDLTKAIREAGELRDAVDTTPLEDGNEPDEKTPEEIEAEEAAALEFKVIPNRKARRAALYMRGEHQPLRSRIRRVVYRKRRKHDAR